VMRPRFPFSHDVGGDYTSREGATNYSLLPARSGRP